MKWTTAFVLMFAVGMACVTYVDTRAPIQRVATVFITNTVTKSQGYTDHDLVRVMGEGALIGYRLGFEDGKKNCEREHVKPAISTNSMILTNWANASTNLETTNRVHLIDWSKARYTQRLPLVNTNGKVLWKEFYTDTLEEVK